MTTALRFDEEQYVHLAKLLLAAAYSDGEFHALERDVIQDFLGDVIGDREMNNRVIKQLVGFEPETFDVEAAVAELPIDSDEQHQAVLAVLARVTDADGEVDHDEIDYLGQIIDVLG